MMGQNLAGQPQSLCPHCGYDLERAEPIEVGRFRFIPDTGAFVDGRRLKLEPARELMFGALIRAHGRLLSNSALQDIAGLDDTEGNTVKVHICHIRRACREAGATDPIETVWGRGYRWKEFG